MSASACLILKKHSALTSLWSILLVKHKRSTIRWFFDKQKVRMPCVFSGFKTVADFFLNSDTFKNAGTEPNYPRFPQCASLEQGSVEFYACVVRFAARSAYHPCGTCRMGSRNDSRSVVDSNLRWVKAKLFMIKHRGSWFTEENAAGACHEIFFVFYQNEVKYHGKQQTSLIYLSFFATNQNRTEKKQ